MNTDLNLTQADIGEVLDSFFDIISTDVLMKGESIRYGSYGKFSIKQVPSRTVKLRNKVTQTTPKVKVTFKPYKKLQQYTTDPNWINKDHTNK